jgi:hypothetical protein
MQASFSCWIKPSALLNLMLYYGMSLIQCNPLHGSAYMAIIECLNCCGAEIAIPL